LIETAWGTNQNINHVIDCMRILITLTYYRPHYSGLTIYAEREARALAARGHEVTVLTSRFDSNLPAEEVRHGVRIIRPRVWFRISKGVIMPGMWIQAWKLAREADVVNLHAPQLDAALVALFARLLGKPVVLTYQCDMQLPHGLVNRLANIVSNLANHITARLSHVIVCLTRDYVDHSPFLKSFQPKIQPIYPPVVMEPATQADEAAFRQRLGLKPDEHIIGMAARLATEKGVEVLARALPQVIEKFPTARVLFVGPYQHVFGEEAYAASLQPLIDRLGNAWTFLGVISPVDMTAFFQTCEVTVLPSVNKTEAYGMVQVESMRCGTPVVASDLPGIRVPVQQTGSGLIFPAGDSQALAEALIQVLSNPETYRGQPEKLLRMSDPDNVAVEYEKIFESLLPAKERDLLWLHLRDLPYFRCISRTVEAKFFQDLPLPAPTLDVGCGDGHFASVTFERPIEVGLDPWSGPIHEAKTRHAYHSLVQADGGKMPIPDGYFASALSNSVLEHIPHIDSVLAETARVLQPGAPFIFSVPNPAYLTELSIAGILKRLGQNRLAERYTEWFRVMSRVQHADGPEVWDARLQQAGFELERYWHYLPPSAFHMLELGHYFGAPSLLPHTLIGRWLWAPTRWNLWLTDKLIRPYTEAIEAADGTFTFFIARRKGQHIERTI
jgi:glycosyltransferase involved in cell wall biosynthesis/ubiquinone/menaquinone biosynthesis C-methylase UbiE